MIVAASFTIASVVDASAAPAQEDPSGSGESATDRGLVEIEVSATDGDPADIADALGELADNVEVQLDQLGLAQAAVLSAERDVSSAASAVEDTEGRIAAIVDDSDAVVINDFINPPQEEAVQTLTESSIADATIRRALLDMQTESDARILAQYEKERRQLVDDKEAKEQALDDAEVARDDAEAALGDLEAAVSQQTQFVLDVQDRLDHENTEGGLAEEPGFATSINELASKLQEIQDATAFQRAQEALREAQQELVARGEIVCPVQGEVNFIDSFGAPRSGGRTHQGTDMMAARGTPTVAPTNGNVVHKSNNLGGTTWYVYADNGDYYYGAHLSAYEGGERRVQAGDVIGYVGNTGDAISTDPHLHLEWHPGGGSAVNPYAKLDRACPNH